MSWMKRIENWATRGGLAVALLAAVLAASTLSAATAELVPIRIGLVPTIESGPFYIAVANRYFKEQGLDAQAKFFDTEAQLRRAAAAGKVDVALADLDAALFADAAKHGFKFIASQASDQSGYPTDAVLIGKNAHDVGFRSVKDLPGKRIAMTAPGSGEQYSLMRIAHRYGLDPRDLKLVWLKTPAQEIAALSRGDVDAATLPFTTVLKLYDAGKGRGVIRLSDLAQRQRGVVFVRAEAIEADRSRVEKFVRAYRRGVAEYAAALLRHDRFAKRVLDAQSRAAAAIVARYVYPDISTGAAIVEASAPFIDPKARIDVADIERQLAWYQARGFVDKTLQARDIVDPSFTAGN
jgi:NitT/TauT family transport system substrate-binding protein